MLVPLGAVFYFSTQEWSSLLSTPRYTGLDNYLALASDARLHRALSNTVVQVVVELLIVIVFGYMLGYFLSLKRWGGNVLLTLCLVPILTSAAARALMFTGIFQPQGLLNNALKFVGLGEFTQPWLGTPETALAVIIVVDVWGAIGFTAVMTSAKLSDGSSEIREAAMLDGAGEWKIMWRVSLPMVAPFVGTLAILHFMWALMHSAQNVLLLTERRTRRRIDESRIPGIPNRIRDEGTWLQPSDWSDSYRVWSPRHGYHSLAIKGPNVTSRTETATRRFGWVLAYISARGHMPSPSLFLFCSYCSRQSGTIGKYSRHL